MKEGVLGKRKEREVGSNQIIHHRPLPAAVKGLHG